MGVDFIACSKCEETFPDCGEFGRCEVGHYLCPRCMPDVPRVWDEDDSEGEGRSAEARARRTDEDELTAAVCPCCLAGGTEVERLRMRAAALAEALRTKLGAAKNQMRCVADACEPPFDDACAAEHVVRYIRNVEAERDALAAKLKDYNDIARAAEDARDAAIARAERAEKRAERLAAALREIAATAQDCMEGAGMPEFSNYAQFVAIARAALAGNPETP